jgi:GNAT superfamily N-acetyltransferase
MQALPELEYLLRLQRSYYQAISTWEPRPWGAIGLNTANPHSHDSNHAYISRRVDADAFAAILAEVDEFYTAAGIEPRARYHVPPNDLALEDVARALGWSSNVEEERWRAWPVDDPHSAPPDIEGLTLSLVGASELEDILRVQNEGADERPAQRRRRVWLAQVADDNIECLLARLGVEPVAGLSCVWREQWGSIEHVQTRAPFRRRGICTAMLRFLQARAAERGAKGLYLYDTIDNADRIYAREGFRLVARPSQVHLWREIDIAIPRTPH